MSEAYAYRIPPYDMTREIYFWLQIFRDHTQFLADTFAPSQSALIAQNQHFNRAFERMSGFKRDMIESCRSYGP